MRQHFKLLDILADGKFHSGQEMGDALGVSRGAVWLYLKRLVPLGIEIHAVPGRGYRISSPLELLSREQILDAMPRDTRDLVTDLEILPEVSSTNSYMMAKGSGKATGTYACLAECQMQGRGRNGQHWVSPFGRNIYLSILWNFSQGPETLAGLGLAMGVGVMRTLRSLGVSESALKWPNDIVCNGAKLAGILIEMNGTSSSNTRVVTGVGLNIDMPEVVSRQIDRQWTDMCSLLGKKVSRNTVAALLIHNLLHVLSKFEQYGLSFYLEEWRRYDFIAGKRVTLRLPHSEVSGISHGVDDKGALLIEGPDNILRFYAGEISRVQLS